MAFSRSLHSRCALDSSGWLRLGPRAQCLCGHFWEKDRAYIVFVCVWCCLCVAVQARYDLAFWRIVCVAGSGRRIVHTYGCVGDAQRC
jgi:hypothetical protein